MNPSRIRGTQNSETRREYAVHIHFGDEDLRPKILSDLSSVTQLLIVLSLLSFSPGCFLLICIF